MTEEERSLLLEGKDLLSHGWIQEAYAQDDLGIEYAPCSEEGTFFCLSGALQRAYWTRKGAYLGENHPVYSALGFTGELEAVRWNDTRGRTQAHVLARIDAALAKENV